MNKNKVLGFVLGTALALAPLAALASTNNVLFEPNGSGSTQVDVGSSVQMHAYIDMTSSQEVESLFVKFPGANGMAAQGICYTVNPSKIGSSPAGGWDISIPVTVPTNAGVWPVAVTAYGINGDGADTTCTGSAVFSTQTFTNRITVTDVNSTATQTGNSGGSGTVGGDTPPSWLAALIAAIMGTHTTPTPTTNTACVALANKMVGAQYGVRNSANIVLQGYLLSEGEQIPALAAGSSFGLWLDQTQAALTHYKSVHSCQ